MTNEEYGDDSSKMPSQGMIVDIDGEPWRVGYVDDDAHGFWAVRYHGGRKGHFFKDTTSWEEIDEKNIRTSGETKGDDSIDDTEWNAWRRKAKELYGVTVT